MYTHPPTPLPEGEGSNKRRTAIEAATQGVLDMRAQFPDATLADLYDPPSMPPALMKAHQALDRAVDAAYIAAEKAVGREPPKTLQRRRTRCLPVRAPSGADLVVVVSKPTRRRRKTATRPVWWFAQAARVPRHAGYFGQPQKLSLVRRFSRRTMSAPQFGQLGVAVAVVAGGNV